MEQAVNYKGRKGCGEEAIFVYGNTGHAVVELCTLSHLELSKQEFSKTWYM